MEGEEAAAPSFHSTKSRPRSSTLWGTVLSKSRVKAKGYHCFHQSNASSGGEVRGALLLAVTGRVLMIESARGTFMGGDGGTNAWIIVGV